jgi:hypothetical protein
MSAVERLKKKWAEEDEREITAAVSALVEHRHGRRFLWHLLTIGRIGTQPFNGDALRTAFSCGELNIGQQVLDLLITTSPSGYITMMKENANERSDRDTALGSASDDDRASDNRDYGDATGNHDGDDPSLFDDSGSND